MGDGTGTVIGALNTGAGNGTCAGSVTGALTTGTRTGACTGAVTSTGTANGPLTTGIGTILGAKVEELLGDFLVPWSESCLLT
jgi:hypothetical protein